MQVQGNRLYDSSLNEKIRKTLAGEDCSDGEGGDKKDKKDKKEKKDKKDKDTKKETKGKETKTKGKKDNLGKKGKKDSVSEGTASICDRLRHLLLHMPIFGMVSAPFRSK